MNANEAVFHNEFIKDVLSVAGTRGEKYEYLRSSHKPVYLYGAGESAERITKELRENGVNISGYAVDSEYYDRNSYLGKPVFPVSDLRDVCGIFVLAMDDEPYGGSRAWNFVHDSSLSVITLDNIMDSIDEKYFTEHATEFWKTYEMLSDDLSRSTMRNFLKLKISGDSFWNESIFCKDQYFNELTCVYSGGTFVDCGAYIGDSIKKYIEWKNNTDLEVIAVEPDASNYKLLCENLPKWGITNFQAYCGAACSEKGEVLFAERASSMSSSIIMDEDISCTSGKLVEAVCIDDITYKNKVSFLKMDIEGGEYEALLGARKMISRDKPVLAVCVYHRSDDLIRIPNFIYDLAKQNNIPYRFYLRKHTRISANELVFYAVPF